MFTEPYLIQIKTRNMVSKSRAEFVSFMSMAFAGNIALFVVKPYCVKGYVLNMEIEEL